MEVPKKKVKDKEIIRSIEFVIIYIDFSEIYMKNVFFFVEGMKTDNFKIESLLEYFREKLLCYI